MDFCVVLLQLVFDFGGQMSLISAASNCKTCQGASPDPKEENSQSAF